MNSQKKIFLILGLVLLLSLGSFFLFTDHSTDQLLIGTVDANQVVVGSQITGRIKSLVVKEGQDVKAGDLIAILDQDELLAAKAASDAQARSVKAQINSLKATANSTSGDTINTFGNAKAALSAAAASLAEATANRVNQESITRRTIALADLGISSAQDRDTAVQTLKATQAREQAAKDQMEAAEASMKAAQARINQAKAANETVTSTLEQWSSAIAQANEAKTRLEYTRIIAPISGKVGIWAAREGEVVNPGTAIITIVSLEDTWVYAPIPETQADSVKIGDQLKVRMPSGDIIDGRVLIKTAEGDFATQRDVNRMKRDIKTVRLKLLISNPGERFVPGMTAEVLIPKSKLVHQ